MLKQKKVNAKVIVNRDTHPWIVRSALRSALLILKKNGFTLSVVFTKRAGHAEPLARQAVEEGYEIVIAAGGDGTINEILNSIVGHDVMLGILPIGTTNVLARELDIPLSINKAARLITQHRTRQIDLGCINGRYFCMMASCGYDAYTISRINLKIKRLIRRYAYVWAGVKDFIGYRPTRIELSIDNGRVREQGSFVALSNTHFYGGSYRLTPYAKVDDGLLDLLIYQGKSQIGLVRFVFQMFWGLHIKMKKVKYYRVKRVDFSSGRKTLVQADGDLIGELPMSAWVVPGAVKVFC